MENYIQLHTNNKTNSFKIIIKDDESIQKKI